MSKAGISYCQIRIINTTLSRLLVHPSPILTSTANISPMFISRSPSHIFIPSIRIRKAVARFPARVAYQGSQPPNASSIQISALHIYSGNRTSSPDMWCGVRQRRQVFCFPIQKAHAYAVIDSLPPVKMQIRDPKTPGTCRCGNGFPKVGGIQGEP